MLNIFAAKVLFKLGLVAATNKATIWKFSNAQILDNGLGEFVAS